MHVPDRLRTIAKKLHNCQHCSDVEHCDILIESAIQLETIAKWLEQSGVTVIPIDPAGRRKLQ